MKIIITGSSGSLGSYIAKSFLNDGVHVLGVDVNSPPPSFLESIDEKHATNWDFYQCDLTIPESFGLALDRLEGAPDAVINNAGSLFSEPLLAFDHGELKTHNSDSWNSAIGINLNAALHVLTSSARNMVMHGKRGVIVNISSISANGNAGQAAYSAAKAGINAITTVAAKEFGLLGIRVAGISPGFFNTESTKFAVTAEALMSIKKKIPLGRFGEPEELFNAIQFVLCNKYFHGKMLELDGGLIL
jgi:3-oxoacyl-[acyl-carrier protein] reductase